MILVKVFLLTAFVVLVFAEEATTPVPIVTQVYSIDPSGDFHWGFESADGSKVEQEGELRAFNDTVQEEVVEGSYEYLGDDNKVYKISYVADENGYQPEGEHIPTIPPLIKKALDYLATLPPKSES